jgi:hypothetical protein
MHPATRKLRENCQKGVRTKNVERVAVVAMRLNLSCATISQGMCKVSLLALQQNQPAGCALQAEQNQPAGCAVQQNVKISQLGVQPLHARALECKPAWLPRKGFQPYRITILNGFSCPRG